jgi:hypothetical protein
MTIPIFFLIYLISIIFKKRVRLFICDGLKINKKLLKIKKFYLFFNQNYELIKNKIYLQFKIKKFFFVYNLFYPDEKLICSFFKNKNYKFFIKKKPKIVYISEVNIDFDKKTIALWKKNRISILKNFALIDDIKFWKKNNLFNNNINYVLYSNFKNLIRYESIKKLYEKFYDDLLLVGSDWNQYGIKSIKIDYNKKFREKIYENNICLDFGSKSGSSTFYSRTIEIIENNGILLQARQSDINYYKNFGQFDNFYSFNSLEEMIDRVNEILKKKIPYTINIKKICHSQEKKFDQFLNYIT